MRNYLFVFVVFSSLSFGSFAQKLEIGAGAGAFHYKGDLQPRFNILAATPGINAFARYNFNTVISVKGNAAFGIINGKEKRVNDPLFQLRRKEFSGLIQEYGGQIEYNFLDFRSTRALSKSEWTSYLFAGYNYYSISNVKFKYLSNTNPATFTTDSKEPYSNNAIQFGVGFKKVWKSNLNFGFEFGARKLKTDDGFDGVGYRIKDIIGYGPNVSNGIGVADPLAARLNTASTHLKDMYFYSNFYISYVFYKVHCPNPR